MNWLQDQINALAGVDAQFSAQSPWSIPQEAFSIRRHGRRSTRVAQAAERENKQTGTDRDEIERSPDVI